MAKPPKIRGIFEQERVTERLRELGVSSLKVDDVMRGLGDTIARKPEIFAKEPITGWSRIIVKGFPPEIPSLRIWFTYDDNDIHIELMEAVDDLRAGDS